MKKIYYLCAVSMVALALTACGANKQAAASSTSQSRGTSPFGRAVEMPCTVFDTPENFAATGVYRGSYKKKDELQLNALNNAKQMIVLKVKGAYRGMMSTYGDSYGGNNGNDVSSKMNRALDFVLEGMLNDASTTCLLWSEQETDGNMECYIAIQISKKELAQKTAQEVSNNLTQDEKDRIEFNEQEYRKQMEERFKQYKDERK